MDVQPKLDEIIALVENARSMPMSASCVVNRSELVERLEELKALLPDELAHAQRLLSDRESVMDEGRREAERAMDAARDERASLVANTEVAREAYAEADRILAQARREASRIREEADDYVDQKLANFEVVLTKTLSAIGRGRDKMRGRKATDELGEYMQAQEEAGPGDGRTLAQRLDGDLDGMDAFAPPPMPVGQPGQPVAQPGAYPQQQPQYAAAAYQQPEEYPSGGYPAYPGPQGGYEHQQYDAPQYEQPGYAPHLPQQAPPQYAALDETSFFDTGLIDVRNLPHDR